MKTPAALQLTALLVSLLLFAGCAVNPVTGRQNFTLMSEAEEMRTGRQADVDIRKEYGVYDSPTLQSYVNKIGQKLAKKSHRPQLNYHFTVVDSPQINAFALPGGYVYITRGI
ncbi:MAG: M48 family metalloprotease, partial [Pseudomonadota bacterium]